MRLKKHLEERIAECGALLLAREGDGYYRLTEEEKLAFRVDLDAAFAKAQPIVLEIGCGKGGWAIQSALLHPDVNSVAVEKLSDVIVVACENVRDAKIENLKFLNVRAENLDRYLPPKSVAQIVLNFSCPFPKKTYANRRLTSANFLNIYKKLLADDGSIMQKTDNREFFLWSMESFRANGFEVTDVCYDLPEKDSVVTEYEAKFRNEGLPIYALKAKMLAQSENHAASK